MIFYRYRGSSLESLGYKDESTHNFEKAIKCPCSSAAEHGARGFALSKLGRYNEAIEEYDKALLIDPKYIIVLLGEAICFLMQNKIHEAKVMVNQVLNIDISNVIALDMKRHIDSLR